MSLLRPGYAVKLHPALTMGDAGGLAAIPPFPTLQCESGRVYRLTVEGYGAAVPAKGRRRWPFASAAINFAASTGTP